MPDLLAGELPPVREDRIRSHIDACRDCAAAFARESLVDRALGVWADEDLPEDALDRIETRVAFAPPVPAAPARRSILLPFSAGFATAASLTFALWLFADEAGSPQAGGGPRAVSDIAPRTTYETAPAPGPRVLEYVDVPDSFTGTPVPDELLDALRRQLGNPDVRGLDDRSPYAPVPVDYEAR